MKKVKLLIFVMIIGASLTLKGQSQDPIELLNISYQSPRLTWMMAQEFSVKDATQIQNYIENARQNLGFKSPEYRNVRENVQEFTLNRMNVVTDDLHKRNGFAKTMKTVGHIGLSGLGGAIPGGDAGFLVGFVLSAIEQGGHELIDYVYDNAFRNNLSDFKEEIEIALKKGLDDGVIQPGMNEATKARAIAQYWLDLAQAEGLPPEAREIMGPLMEETALELYLNQSDRMLGIEAGLVDLSAQLESFREKTSWRIDNLEKDMATNYAETMEAVGVLAANQKMIMEELNELQDRVRKNTLAIRQNELAIRQNTNDIQNNRKRIQANYAMISQNKLDIEIINGYLLGTLDVDDKIKAIEKGHLGTADWDEKDRKETLQKLKLFKTTETLTTVANYVFEASGLISSVFPNSKAAKKVAEVMTYAAKGIKVGVTVISALGPPPNAGKAIEAVFQVFGLFKKPTESPEMKMLKHINTRLDTINQKLDGVIMLLQDGVIPYLKHLDDKLNYIADQLIVMNQNIIDLTNFSYDFYIATMNSFEFVYNELDRINYKLDVLINMTRAVYFEDFARCRVLRERLQNQPLRSYKDHETYFDVLGNSCSECLDGLRKFLDTEEMLPFNMSTYIDKTTIPGSKSFAETEIDMYSKAKTYFDLVYTSRRDVAFGGLLVGLKDRGDQALLRQLLRQDSISIRDLPYEQMLQPANYLNPQAVVQIAKDYLQLMTFYEVEGDIGYRPMSFEDYLVFPPETKKERSERILKELEFLNKVVNQAIAQQTLFAGQNITDAIFNELFIVPSSETRQNLALDVLAENEYVQQNFLKKLFLNVMNGNSEAEKALITALEDMALGLTIDYNELNSKVNRLGLSIKFEKVHGPYGDHLGVYGDPKSLSTNKKVVIPIPPVFLIEDQDMVYPSSVYELNGIRNMIGSMIGDVTMSGAMADVFGEDSVSHDLLKYVALSGMLPDTLQYAVYDSVHFEYIAIPTDSNFQAQTFVNPNPTDDVLFIHIQSKEEGEKEVRLLSIDGKVERVLTIPLNYKVPISIGYLPSGVYLLQIDNQIIKLVKQ